MGALIRGLAFSAMAIVSHPAPAAPGLVMAAAPVRVADLPPEVRVRRLHLVRPDLISYPLDIEVVC